MDIYKYSTSLSTTGLGFPVVFYGLFVARDDDYKEENVAIDFTSTV